MAGLFQGDPQTATSSSVTSTNIPTWMQDAIYNQIQWSTNLANTPYQQYQQPLVASLSPLQQQAHQQTQANQGAWAPQLNQAAQGTQAIASSPDSQAAAQPYYNQQAGALGSINYQQPTQSLSPYVQQAMRTSGVNAASPYIQGAGQSSVSDISNYMNPYTRNVTDQIAKLGAVVS